MNEKNLVCQKQDNLLNNFLKSQKKKLINLLNEANNTVIKEYKLYCIIIKRIVRQIFFCKIEL